MLDIQYESIIANYMRALSVEINPSKSYSKVTSTIISLLSKFTKKDFRDITREDIIDFLDTLRKPEEIDPLHKWIGSYNLYLGVLIRFFKWFNYQSLPHRERPKPPVIMNIPHLKRKEKSIYKSSDMWTSDHDLIFLKYCSSKRNRCYHAIAKDTSCRPHELLNLKIKDIVFKMAGDRQYAEIIVNGKTGQRHIPIINSIPYLKDWLDDHPFRISPNSNLICGLEKSKGSRIGIRRLWKIYANYKEYFAKLLDNPNIPHEDKLTITELLKKPWNPYIIRHSALTDKAKILKSHVLTQHAGWTITSKMPQIYIHFFGNESSESILEAYGLTPKLSEIDKMKSKQCPNCNEPNKPDSKFCAKCRMVLVYDEYIESLEKQKKKENEIEEMKRDIQIMKEGQKEWVDLLRDPNRLLGILRRDANLNELKC